MTPRFTHDCEGCTLFFADDYGDWYVCGDGSSYRSVIMRYGNSGPDYQSTPLCGRAEVTRLEMAALSRGLHPTSEEKSRLLRIMLNEKLDKLALKDWGFVFGPKEGPDWREW